MDIKPIRSETDYEAALKEIEIMVNSQPGTPEGDRMDVLITLVQAYEASHYPIPEPDDPVGVLEYYMESRGLNRADGGEKGMLIYGYKFRPVMTP